MERGKALKLRCRKCQWEGYAIRTSLAAASYDWRLSGGNWGRKVWCWEHPGSCLNAGRYWWYEPEPFPFDFEHGFEAQIEE